MRTQAVGFAIAILVAAGLGVGYLAGNSNRQTSTSTFISTTTLTSRQTVTSTSISGNCSEVTISGYAQYCAAPLSYAAFQLFVNQSTSIEHQNGAIILSVGHNPCTDQFYVLPNATDVEIHLGTVNVNQTCA